MNKLKHKTKTVNGIEIIISNIIVRNPEMNESPGRGGFSDNPKFTHFDAIRFCGFFFKKQLKLIYLFIVFLETVAQKRIEINC